MDKAKVRLVDAEIHAALKAIAEKHGLKLKGGGTINYDSTSFRRKIEMRDASALTKEAQYFLDLCDLHGLKRDDLNRTFQMSGCETYKVIGLLPRSRALPILVEVSGASIVKMSATSVKAWLELQDKRAAEASIGKAPRMNLGG